MLPVTTIGGYLGAGKTTLVNHLLRHADGLKIAVLVNEFGELPIDEDLIEAKDDDLISIAGGCVCCSYGNDLIEALLTINKMQPQPDHILIEASGVALPGAIAASIGLLDGFNAFGTVTIGDAQTIIRQAKDPYIGDTIERQLEDANLILLNKSDLVAADDVRKTENWLNETAPQALVCSMMNGNVPNSIVLQQYEPNSTPPPATFHSDSDQYETASLFFDHPVDANHVASTLADQNSNLIRAKGFVPTALGLKAIQVVGQKWAVSDAPQTAPIGIVVIAKRGELNITTIQNKIGAIERT